MKPVLIGSRALAYWLGGKHWEKVENSDWDIISDEPLYLDQGLPYEHHASNHLNNYAMAEVYATDDKIVIDGISLNVMSLKGLSIIKRSHLWRDLSFQKHITSYHRHLAQEAKKYGKLDRFFLNQRTRLTHEAYPQGHPSLKKSVSEFFDDAVKKKYDHDMLHKMYAYYNKPLYLSLQDDTSSAWCDMMKFQSMSLEDRNRCAAEETYVIATERFLVPTDYKTPTRLAYLKALDKVCTRLCSGVFRDYAIDNYPQIADLYDDKRFKRVKQELALFDLAKQAQTLNLY